MHDGPRRWLTTSAFFIAAALAAGCSSSGKVGDTNVGRRELYRVDNTKYDEFFEDVFDLQKQSALAREKEAKAREPLASALEAGQPSGDALAGLAAERAKKMALGRPKILLALEGVETNGSLVLGKAIAITPAAAKRKPWPKDARDFTAALEETLRAEGNVVDKYGPLAGKARRRLEIIDKLREAIADTFPSAKAETRDRLKRELAASRPALTAAAAECERVSALATNFLRLSAEGIAAAREAKPEPKKPSKR
jgi:outer membrane murein-binding lipoprotein Lpp